MKYIFALFFPLMAYPQIAYVECSTQSALEFFTTDSMVLLFIMVIFIMYGFTIVLQPDRGAVMMWLLIGIVMVIFPEIFRDAFFPNTPAAPVFDTGNAPPARATC